MGNFVYYIILLLLIQRGNSIFRSASDLTSSITRQIQEDVRPYQVVLFTNINDTIISSTQCFVIESIIENIPTVLVDLEKSKTFNNPFSHLIAYKNLRHVSLNLIVWSKTVPLMNLQKYLDSFVKISPKYTRAKCLVVLYDDNEFDDDIKIILRYSWSKKILDFSLIKIQNIVKSNKLEVYVHYYNPFYDTYSILNYNEQIKIFPDKLHDGNKYGLKVPIYTYFPHLNIIKDKSNQIKKIYGLHYAVMAIAFEILNFSMINIEYSGNKAIHEIIDDLFNDLEMEKLSMTVSPFFIRYDLENSLALDVGFVKENMIFITPVLPIKSIYVSLDAFVYLFLIPSIMWSLHVLINIYNNNMTELRLLNVFQILFGQSVIHTQNYSNRKIIFFITALSCVYAIHFYSLLMNIKVVQSELSFDTYQELNKSTFKFYIVDAAFKHAFGNNSDPYVQSIKSKTTKTKNFEVCEDMLLKNRNVICISSVTRANLFIQKYRKNDGKSIAKLAKPVLYLASWVYYFEKASVYIEKFHKVLQRAFESGIDKAFINRITVNNELLDEVEEVDTLLFLCTLILIIGYLISFLVFLIEVHIVLLQN